MNSRAIKPLYRKRFEFFVFGCILRLSSRGFRCQGCKVTPDCLTAIVGAQSASQASFLMFGTNVSCYHTMFISPFGFHHHRATLLVDAMRLNLR